MLRLTALLIVKDEMPRGEAISATRLEEILKPVVSDRFSAFYLVVWIKKTVVASEKDLPPNLVPGVEDGVVIVNGQPVSRENIRLAYSHLLSEAEALQESLLLGANADFDLAEVIDTRATLRGAMIQPSADSVRSDEIRQRILLRVEGDEELRGEWLDVNNAGQPQLRSRKAMDFLESYAKYLEMLVPLVHIGGGMPARGTELVPYRICDTGNGDRSVFWLDGHVYLYARYNKSSSMTGSSRPIARFLDKRLTKLMLRDLFLVRPFVILLATYFGKNQEQAYNTELFLQGGEKMRSDQVLAAFEMGYLRATGCRLNFSSYRHVAKHFGNEVGLSFDHENENLVENEQAGHNRSTADRHYARMTTEHADLRHQKLVQFRSFSFKWHEWLQGSGQTQPIAPRTPAPTAQTRKVLFASYALFFSRSSSH